MVSFRMGNLQEKSCSCDLWTCNYIEEADSAECRKHNEGGEVEAVAVLGCLCL